jgi:hypothetical protein
MITAMVAIIAVAVIPMIPTTIIPMFIPATAMPFLVTRNILVVVPVVPHKEDPLAAGVIFSAVPGPMPAVAWRYAQIDRFAFYLYPLDYSRLSIDHLWLWIVADVESAIEAWLADANRNSNVGSKCRGGSSGSSYCRCDQKTFHVESPIVGGS